MISLITAKYHKTNRKIIITSNDPDILNQCLNTIHQLKGEEALEFVAKAELLSTPVTWPGESHTRGTDNRTQECVIRLSEGADVGHAALELQSALSYRLGKTFQVRGLKSSHSQPKIDIISGPALSNEMLLESNDRLCLRLGYRYIESQVRDIQLLDSSNKDNELQSLHFIAPDSDALARLGPSLCEDLAKYISACGIACTITLS